jgi:hypothetical protein
MKVVYTAPSNNMRADKVATETAKTGKVTAVVAVMSIFCRMRCKLRSTNPENEKPSCHKREKCQFIGGKFLQTKKPFSGNEKRLDFDKISAYIKENRAK